ncbi:MAG: hypothetical protein ACTSWW_07395, partial [Promethearchaeota archaeon]
MELNEIQISRYNPRLDREGLLELVKDFEYRVGEERLDLEKFSVELDKRSLDLKLRNSMILGKIDNRIIGAGFFSLWTDYLG